MKVANENVEGKDELVEVFSDFQRMWDRHLGWINTANHWTKISPSDAKPMHRAPHQAGPKTRKFEENMLDKCFRKELSRLRRCNGQHRQCLRRKRVISHAFAYSIEKLAQLRIDTSPGYHVSATFLISSSSGRSSLRQTWTLSAGKLRSKMNIERTRFLSHTTYFIALSGFHLDYRMLRARSSERCTLRCQRLNCSLH